MVQLCVVGQQIMYFVERFWLGRNTFKGAFMKLSKTGYFAIAKEFRLCCRFRFDFDLVVDFHCIHLMCVCVLSLQFLNAIMITVFILCDSSPFDWSMCWQVTEVKCKSDLLKWNTHVNEMSLFVFLLFFG